MMMVPDQNKKEGHAIDDYLAHTPAPAAADSQVQRKSQVPLHLARFSYLECIDCHVFHEIDKVHDIREWRFSLMGLRPSILNVAKGLCPICQEMRKQFKAILR